MNPRQLYSVTVAVAAVLLGGCRAHRPPRVVRLELAPMPGRWQFSVDGNRARTNLRGTSAVAHLAALHLQQGDVVLLGLPRPQKSNPRERTSAAISALCESNNVPIYLLPAETGLSVFSIPAFHWTAPYENPFDMTNAVFYREGKLLGRSNTGFQSMLFNIKHERPKTIFILGSLYDLAASLPPDAAPFEAQRDVLYDTLKASGTERIDLGATPGF